MMTSSNGNIFRVTGHLCGEFTGPGEFPTQRPVTRSFDVYFDLLPNKRLSKQSWGWWFETQSCPLWRHRNAYHLECFYIMQLLTYYHLYAANLNIIKRFCMHRRTHAYFMSRLYVDNNTFICGGAGQIFDNKHANIIPIREVPRT